MAATPEEIEAEKERLRRLEEKNNQDMAEKGIVNPYGDS
jgi:hypothetical protein